MKKLKSEIDEIQRAIQSKKKSELNTYSQHHETIVKYIQQIYNFYEDEAQKLKMKFKSKYLGSLQTQNNIELLKQFCVNDDLLGTKYH